MPGNLKPQFWETLYSLNSAKGTQGLNTSEITNKRVISLLSFLLGGPRFLAGLQIDHTQGRQLPEKERKKGKGQQESDLCGVAADGAAGTKGVMNGGESQGNIPRHEEGLLIP